LPKPIHIALASALAAAVLVCGCGGSSDTGAGSVDTTTLAKGDYGPLTKEDFIAEADTICRKGGDTRYDEAGKFRTEHREELNGLEPVPREERVIRAVVLPSLLKQVREIKALGAPKGDEKEVKAIILEIEKGIRQAKKSPYAIELEVPNENPLRNATELMRDYGFNDCRNFV
jgi:hypothetical protein